MSALTWEGGGGGEGPGSTWNIEYHGGHTHTLTELCSKITFKILDILSN